MNIGIVGAGIFGAAAALELGERGHAVAVFEQGRVPYEHASSTDASKTIRRLYGRNRTYVELVERAAVRWREWQERLGVPIYFQTGQLQIEQYFRAGYRIYESWEFLEGREPRIEILTPGAASARYPQFAYRDGDVCLYDPWGGYVASADAVAGVVRLAREAGVDVCEDSPVSDVFETSDGACVRIGGRTRSFDAVVVAAGVWTGRLLPGVGRHIGPTLQEMVFLRPRDPSVLAPGGLPVWSVNPEVDGWYGHPVRGAGLVKIANDVRGELVDADAPRIVRQAFLESVRAFVAERLPALEDAELVDSRACLYEDTPDHDFIIDWVPGSDRVLAACGGSGHGFKFGGSIGGVIADAVERRDSPPGVMFRLAGRFR